MAGTRSRAVGLLILIAFAGLSATHVGWAGGAVRAQLDSGTATTPGATPRSLIGTPVTAVAGTAGSTPPTRTGIASRVGQQQAAAQATIAAQATRIARTEAALAAAQVMVTEAAQVAASAVLDPTRQTVTVQTDLGGMLTNDEAALAAARSALGPQLSRYADGCRAGFMLISGKAPTIEEGVQLARQIDGLLRQGWPEIVDAATGVEVFALPNEPPLGEVSIDIFFYSGCVPGE